MAWTPWDTWGRGCFVDSVRNQKQPRTTGESGRAVIEVVGAAYLSAQQGREVSQPLFELREYEAGFQFMERRLSPRYRETD